jgi:acetylornithine/succinyldiaminopimelate/putrescine aminotransferase
MNYRTAFLNHVAQTSEEPMLFQASHAKGSIVYDELNNPYYDLIAGISVSSVGHCHPQVIEAITKQINLYSHLMVYGEFVQGPQVELATMLSALLPSSLSTVYFVNSGNEAIDGAAKLVKRITGKSRLISCFNAYHGSGHGALSLMGSEFFKSAYRPLLPGIDHLRFGSFEDLQLITEEHAGIVIETVQGESGCLTAPPGYFEALRKRCNETGTLIIADEIQCGMGRTGSWFAFEQENFVPDVLCLAKAFGAGLPLGAFVSSKQNMHTLTIDPPLGHITTFGGNPVCCAASIAGIKVMEENGLIVAVKAKEQLLRSRLIHPLIKEISGRGLLLKVGLESWDVNYKVIAACRKHGVLTDWFLFCVNGFRVAPPLTISMEELDLICTKVLTALDEVALQI